MPPTLHDVPHELLTDADIRRRFPPFQIADGDRGYFEPTGGYLFPEECIAAQLSEAARLGATLNYGEAVTRFEASASGVTVTTSRATYSADKIVISAGPWLPKLVSKPLADQFTIRRQVLYWFRIGDKAVDRYRPDAFPVFIWQTPRQQTIYGFPWVGTDEPTIKIATEQYETETSADKVERNVSAAESKAMFDDYVAEFFPGLRPESAKTAVCMYTCVEGARFVVDSLPDQPRVIVASPCSGHGFKHSAAIGEAIAKRAIEGTAAELTGFALPAVG